jgi:hypothetical protein
MSKKVFEFFYTNVPEWTFLIAVVVIQWHAFRYLSADFSFDFGYGWCFNMLLLLSIFPLFANVTFIRIKRLQNQKIYLHAIVFLMQLLVAALIVSSFYYDISNIVLFLLWLLQLTVGHVYMEAIRKEQQRYAVSVSRNRFAWVLPVLVALSPAWLMISSWLLAVYLYLYHIVDDVPKIILIFLNPIYSLGISLVALLFLYLRYLTHILHGFIVVAKKNP